MFKPMLAAKAPPISELRFPLLASPKLDGIRCCIVDGVPLSRNLKPIPNRSIFNCLKGLSAFDGELIVGEPTGNDVWNRSNSGVMSRDGEPDFTFWVFDFFGNSPQHVCFAERLKGAAISGAFIRVRPLKHEFIHDAAELTNFESNCVAAGYEGVMLRDPNGPYKFGRATAREGSLMKLKRFEDHEATVIGFVEQMHNGNEATRDALGRMKRSTAQAGKVGKDTLGALECMLPTGHVFELGSGFTDAQRAVLWSSPPLGRLATFKCQGFTPDGLPRFPVFKGFRETIDV